VGRLTDRDPLIGCTLRLPGCGCTIEGAGTLPDPVRIVYCADHAAVQAPVRTSGDAAADRGRRLNEAFNDALQSGAANWCRARLLRGLALAAKQAVLDEVLEELLPNTHHVVLERLLRNLTLTGWLQPGDRAVP
jgi:hypothetical protein